MKKISSVIWGIVLIAAGALFALNALNITNIDIFFDGWWTLFIIVPLCCRFVYRTRKDRQHYWYSSWCIPAVMLSGYIKLFYALEASCSCHYCNRGT